jgi:hypothetical protein
MRHSRLSSALTEIQAIYSDFGEFWKSQACRRTRAALRARHIGAEPEHRLGRFIILYTPIATIRPQLMLVGNNPSWFHRTRRKAALANLATVAEKIPVVNSFLEHDHSYSRTLRKVFHRLNRIDLLEGCVGLNRLWIQIGSRLRDQFPDLT